MTKLIAAAVAVFALGAIVARAQQPTPAIQPTRFAGTWVGTQSWAIANPPPGSRQDQPVTLTLEVAEDGKIAGSLKPFLGGEDGATIIDAKIVGEELHAGVAQACHVCVRRVEPQDEPAVIELL